MGSTRLPGKVLRDICGQPTLTRVARRLRQCKRLNDIVLATTTDAADDVLEQWAQSEGVAVHRGSDDDVLARVVEAHHKLQSDVAVVVTGDCPLLDPEIIDMGVATFFENECDVVTSVRSRTFPLGMDIGIVRVRDLAHVGRTVHDPAVREHVALYLYENPQRYRSINVVAPARWSAPHYRFTLDYPEDLRFISEVYTRLEPEYGDCFGIEEMMALLRREPELLKINGHRRHEEPRD